MGAQELIATTEWEDRPLKYPTLITTCDVLVINKMDIAEAVECDVALLEHNFHKVRPAAPTLKASAKKGTGLDEWAAFLREQFK